MTKHKKQPKISPPVTVPKPTKILLDECFLQCASGGGCDAKYCQDEPDQRQRRALMALLLAYESKIALVLDDQIPSQVAGFYQKKYKFMNDPVRELIVDWLSGRGQTIQQKPSTKLNPKAIKECNLKPNTLDPLLCQLAIACGGDAPIWTLDSDIWDAIPFHAEIKPVCPKEALNSVR